MFADVGVIWRTLKGDIEGDFESLLFCRRAKVLEIFECAELGKNGFVAALGGSDCPGAAGVCGLRLRGIIFTFSK